MLFKNNPHRSVIIWLFTGCFLIFAMVVIGGITRLTLSGLSIVEWDLLMGTIPPLNEQDWQVLFLKYQQTPQYNLVNYHFTLSEFKSIFWWEYIHRLIGRLIGLVFIIPFIYFWIKKRLNSDLIKKLVLIFFLGGFQGFLGWFMVKSGLVNNPQVSHLRLAAHLITAFISFGFTFKVALDLIYPERINSNAALKELRQFSLILFFVVTVQIIYGAFVAGLRAGKVYTTFPKMGDDWVAEGVFAMEPFWKNLLENIAGVQFIHRYIAYIVVILVVVIWLKSKKLGNYFNKKGFDALLIFTSIQFLLGVFTLVYAVPILLGVLHQTVAFFLFAACIYNLHRLRFKN
jgi:heme a synthase